MSRSPLWQCSNEPTISKKISMRDQITLLLPTTPWIFSPLSVFRQSSHQAASTMIKMRSTIPNITKSKQACRNLITLWMHRCQIVSIKDNCLFHWSNYLSRNMCISKDNSSASQKECNKCIHDNFTPQQHFDVD